MTKPMIHWKKGTKFMLSEHFSTHEFECKCSYVGCISQKISQDVIEAAEEVRAILGRPFSPNSAFRCVRHNMDEGSGPKSQHPAGMAFDVPVSSDVEGESLEVVVGDKGGFGRYDGFVHLDFRGTKARWNFRKGKHAA